MATIHGGQPALVRRASRQLFSPPRHREGAGWPSQRWLVILYGSNANMHNSEESIKISSDQVDPNTAAVLWKMLGGGGTLIRRTHSLPVSRGLANVARNGSVFPCARSLHYQRERERNIETDHHQLRRQSDEPLWVGQPARLAWHSVAYPQGVDTHMTCGLRAASSSSPAARCGWTASWWPSSPGSPGSRHRRPSGCRRYQRRPLAADSVRSDLNTGIKR